MEIPGASTAEKQEGKSEQGAEEWLSSDTKKEERT